MIRRKTQCPNEHTIYKVKGVHDHPTIEYKLNIKKINYTDKQIIKKLVK